MDTSPIPVEALLAHREWVRSVARAVVRDPNAGDDVEQDAWFEALHAPPQQASSLRGWFGAVVRNRARRMGRTTKRRTARETAAARPEATQSAADLAEIADTHRRVVQAVVELDEPYRETILLRYFEGLAVDVVAARTNAPLNTARARISRGLAKLRERLAEELGEDDRPWQMVLVPLIGKSHGTGLGAAAAGGGVMLSSTVQWGLAAAAAMALTGVAVVVAIAA
jgi:RNA polymerase sigma-70 factor (ECF subfamily)